MNKIIKSLIISALIISSFSSCKSRNDIESTKKLTESVNITEETSSYDKSEYSDLSVSDTQDNQENYEWVLEPNIDADDIIVVDMESELYENYAIIKKDNKFGIISTSGEMVSELEYDYYFGCVINKGEYILKNDNSDKWDCFTFENGKIQTNNDTHGHDVASRFLFYKDRDRNQVYFSETYGSGCQYEIGKMSWNNIKGECYPLEEVCNINVGQEYDYGIVYKWDRTGKWGIVSDNGDIVEQCIYDNGCVRKNLVMMKKDGKWAYFKRDGQKIIDNIALDTYKNDNYMDISNTINQQNNGFFPFIDVNGIIAVNTKNNGGIFYNMEGTSLTGNNEFEEVRPAINNIAWVKKDKKWGVIKIKTT